jgi:phosphoribosylpyrophosphate synthetase
MKNRLIDLNDHLFAQMERLSDEELSPEKIDQEVKRAEAIVLIGDQIIRTADTTLKAAKLVAEHGDKMKTMLPSVFKQPQMIEGKVEGDAS